MTARIRPYRSEDEERVIEIWSQAARAAHPFLPGEGTGERERLIRQVYVPVAETWVYHDTDGQIQGFIALLAHENAPWEVGGLFVAPDAWRRGIGQALISHAAGLKGTLTLVVFEKNLRARRAYERMGFVPNGETSEDSGFRQIGMMRAA